MKLLLTSGGITNPSIKDALVSLVRKTPRATKIGFIPTAMNSANGNKDWFIDQLTNLREYGYTWIDIVDPSAPGVNWRARLREVDVIFVSGGNTFHLLDQFRKTGFDRWLNQAVKEKVYVGVSAGTIIATPTIDIASLPPSDPNLPQLENLRALRFVPFEIEPHCDNARFSSVEFYSKTRNNAVYALDDNSAVRINGDKIDVVSEGVWKLYD